MLDIKITGGTIIDGKSNQAFKADIGVIDDRIYDIGDFKNVESKMHIDATGKIVAPGFIDIHTHSDMSIIYDRRASSMIHDGVTTQVVGNCGIGVVPIKNEKKKMLIDYLATRLIGSIPVELELPWNTVKEYLDYIDQRPPATNIVALLAQGPVRINEMGFVKEAADNLQIERIKNEITIAMEEGCAGLSSGLVYMPGEYTSTDELIECCKAIAPFNRFYATHMRSEGDDMFDSLEEAMTIALKSGTALHVSHLKLAGREVRGQTDRLFERIERAKNEGLDMTFDAYPYSSGSTSLGACMPPWAFEGGVVNLIKRLKDPEMRSKMRKDIENGIKGWQNFAKSCESWSNITISSVSTEKGKILLGKTIEQLAEIQSKDPYEVMFDTLIQENGRVQILNKMMSDEDVAHIISHPATMISSDGMNLSTEGIMSTGNPHPRAFGTRSRILSKYVRDKKLIKIEDAIKKMTSMPARRLHLKDRGILKKDYYADIVIFDSDTIQDTATFETPKNYSKGISTVMVNGKIALENGTEMEVYSGNVLRIKQ